MRGGLIALLVSLIASTGTPAMPQVSAEILRFDDLDGWAEDDHELSLIHI